MADNNDDINLKKADQAAQYALIQERMATYRQKIVEVQNRDFQGRYQGISVKMNGNFDIVDVAIDQGYYETAGKSQLEKAILVCLSNLHNAIEQETKAITDQMQAEMARFQADALAKN